MADPEAGVEMMNWGSLWAPLALLGLIVLAAVYFSSQRPEGKAAHKAPGKPGKSQKAPQADDLEG
ncbi:MAG TPA: hypothetical protein V6D06_08515 [Trichocoleus sp.]